MKFLVHTHISHNKKKDKNHYSSRNNSLLLPQETPPTTPKGAESSCSLTAAHGHCPVAARAWQVLPTGTCAWPGGTRAFQAHDPIMFSRGNMDISQRTCVILLPQTHTFLGDFERKHQLQRKSKNSRIHRITESPAVDGSHKDHRVHLQALHGPLPRIPPQTHFCAPPLPTSTFHVPRINPVLTRAITPLPDSTDSQ